MARYTDISIRIPTTVYLLPVTHIESNFYQITAFMSQYDRSTSAGSD